MSFGLLLHGGGILVAGKLARGVQVPNASRGKETTTTAAAISLKVLGTLVLRSGIWHLLPP